MKSVKLDVAMTLSRAVKAFLIDLKAHAMVEHVTTAILSPLIHPQGCIMNSIPSVHKGFESEKVRKKDL